ncbi:nucleoside-diphosphate kinase [Candidatus Saccharibacteria bacterium]|nr:nucleoside-diphosphate kinase [Candidatus Saccharibacteria bacterium]MBI3337794.1 nucleoside-diphosphate kinase [Candidatus Saccharibacteria bacterium]
MERTLIILKPDAVKRGIVGEVLTRFERVGLKVVGCKMLQPDYNHYHHHYEKIGQMITRRGEEIFEVTLEMMKEGPVIALVLEGIEAVSLVRKMVGETEPKSAAPGTIRGDYSHISFNYADKEKIAIPNIIHASGDPKEAKQEIGHWFSDSELFEYNTTHETYTQAHPRKQ